MEQDLLFKKISENIIYSNYRKILNKKFEHPDGVQSDYEIIHSNTEVAVVVALDENGDLILAKQFRPGIEKIVIEFPGGACEKGETLIESAKRELVEETGYTTDDITEIGAFRGESMSDALYHTFLAKNCRKSFEQKLENTEFIEVVLMNVLDYEKYCTENILSAINLVSFYLVKSYIYDF